jgi:hypothetical protein
VPLRRSLTSPASFRTLRCCDTAGRVTSKCAAISPAVHARNPFAKDGREPTTLHVTFLAGSPDRSRVGDLDSRQSEPDEFRVVGREVYLHCPGGYGRTKLTNAFFEKRLGVAATTRNWKTSRSSSNSQASDTGRWSGPGASLV